jgi:hypothetical protein
MSAEIKIEEQLTCDECGRHGAMALDDRKLCPDCYANAGACCSEWRLDKQKTETDL